MANIDLNLGSFGVGVLNYTLKHRVFGTSTFLTTNTNPANPIPSTNLTPQITGVLENTIYEIQVQTNCNGSTANSSVVRKTTRACPTLAQHNVSVTDTTVTTSFPLSTPAPISTHISNIVVELYQGLTLVSTQTLTSLNATNAVTFTGLNQNTTYSVKHFINFAASDSIPLSSYPNSGDDNTMVCIHNVTTDSTPVCPTPVVISITQS